MFAEKALREMRELLPVGRKMVYDEILRQLISHPPRERRGWLIDTLRVLPVLRETKMAKVRKTLEEAA